jgi:hypothetical protein
MHVDFAPDPSLSPFESRWFESSTDRTHYIDDGTGPGILLCHGTRHRASSTATSWLGCATGSVWRWTTWGPACRTTPTTSTTRPSSTQLR